MSINTTIIYRNTADIFTGCRFLLSAVLIYLGLYAERSGFVTAVALLFIGWTIDILDGPLARRSGHTEQGWISQHDFLADMVMVYGSLIYFMLAGFVSLVIFVGYSGLAAIIIYRWPFKAMVMTIAIPAVALPLVLAFQFNQVMLWALLTWVALALILEWGRFKGVVRDYIVQMRSEF